MDETLFLRKKYILTNKLDLVRLLQYAQEIAGEHARHLGLGHERLQERTQFWALTRQRVEMSEWPAVGSELEIETWPRQLQGMIATRDFEVKINGQVIGHITSDWVVLDFITRKILRPNLEGTLYPSLSPRTLAIGTTKINLDVCAKPQFTHKVTRADLDKNGHVNNTRYAAWVLPLIATPCALNAYHVNFSAEAREGDEITLWQDDKSQEIVFRGIRSQDQKTIFSSRFVLNGHAR